MRTPPRSSWRISALYERAGFAYAGHTEIIYFAAVEDLRRAAGAPIEGLSVRRAVGMNGTRLSAMVGEDVIGYIEVEIFDQGERLSRNGRWADVGNLHVAEPYRRRGVGSWLLSQAANWLRVAGADRLLDYAWLDGTDPGGLDYADYRAFLPAAGFQELTRTRRGWIRMPHQAALLSAPGAHWPPAGGRPRLSPSRPGGSVRRTRT